VATIIGCPLPDPYASRVASVRAELVTDFGIDEYGTPEPHFTLFPLPDDVDVTAVETAVADAAADHDPLPVHTDGLGVFPGNHVWLPVAKSPELTALHAAVVEAVAEFGPPPVPFYRPGRWFPHVGFALGVDDERAGAIVEHLLADDFEWDCTVDTITIAQPPADDVLASIPL
jgi:2'-5' RNA ligase